MSAQGAACTSHVILLDNSQQMLSETETSKLRSNLWPALPIPNMRTQEVSTDLSTIHYYYFKRNAYSVVAENKINLP